MRLINNNAINLILLNTAINNNAINLILRLIIMQLT